MGRNLLKLSICYKQNLFILFFLLYFKTFMGLSPHFYLWQILLNLFLSKVFFQRTPVIVFSYKLMWLGTSRSGWWPQRLIVVLWAREESEMWSLRFRHQTGDQGSTALVTVALILRGLGGPCTGVQVDTIAAFPRW